MTAGRPDVDGSPAPVAHRLSPVACVDALDVAPGTRAALLALAERLAGALAFDRRFVGRGRRRHRALIVGPPGSGRRAAARAVAAQIEREAIAIDVERLLATWNAETGAEFAGLLAVAEAGDTVLLFDGAEGLIESGTGAPDAAATITRQLESFDGVALLVAEGAALVEPRFARALESIVELPCPGDGAGLESPARGQDPGSR